MTLRPGTRITIHGRPATVVNYNYSTGKYEVRIDGLTINTFHTKIDPPNGSKKTTLRSSQQLPSTDHSSQPRDD